MAVTTIVRMSGMTIAGPSMDVQWIFYWQEVETTIAVIMVSITAFRSLFGIKTTQTREKKQQAWYSYCDRLLARRSKWWCQGKRSPRHPRRNDDGTAIIHPRGQRPGNDIGARRLQLRRMDIMVMHDTALRRRR
jgi:hypothetical protein